MEGIRSCVEFLLYTKRGGRQRRVNVGYNRRVEKAMAPYSSTLAWTIPWMEEPGGLQSMGSLRVGHD